MAGFSLLALGALYRDVIVTIPSFPAEDTKLAAVSERVRVGGNISNSLTVLAQVVAAGTPLLYATVVGGPEPLWRPLVAALEAQGITMLYEIRDGENATTPTAYIFESQATGSRTIISHQLIPPLRSSEVTALLFTHFMAGSALLHTHEYDEMLSQVWNAHAPFFPSWLHFEGRDCFAAEGVIDHFTHRSEYKTSPCVISVELEKHGRPGLDRLAGLADVLFVAEGYAREVVEEAKNSSWTGVGDTQLVVAFAQVFKRRVGRGRSVGASNDVTVFMTMGAAGAYVLRFAGAADAEVEAVHVPAPRLSAEEVVETTGAGDTFIAATIYAMGYRGWSAVKAAKVAVNVATRKCMQVGFGSLGTADGFGRLESDDDPLGGVLSARSSVGPDARRMEGLL
ncbi:hypothetical protein DRE_06478 [Drechslerella stenobrocha 248]|uniref:Carbohydrate kinase PfkB domain-containing protein n=1 Tax=Drechslerella stenobrocha 248 TaxID=1043628 RepID=W7I6Y7_9PEZI|nr:hypothetical protein DRE_06478 [Drechslerella stenobrocha 248]